MSTLGAPEPTARSLAENRSTRCPECGGLNPADADWCGQCHASFGAPPTPSGAASPDAGPGDSATDEFASWLDLLPVAEPPAGTDPATEPALDPLSGDEFDPLTDPFPGPEGSRRHLVSEDDYLQDEPDWISEHPRARKAEIVERRSGAFAIAGEKISWTCSRCDTDNPLEADVCTVCGTAFAEIVGPPPQPRITRDPNMAALVSLFFPGVGHAYLGMWGQAVARAALSAWVLAVVIIAVMERGVPGATLTAIVYGLAALALWALGAHDVFREANDQSNMVILRPRAFLYVTIALLVVLFASLMLAGFSATRIA